MAAFAGREGNVLVAGSLSKTYAMTGWRIGFVLAPAPVVGGDDEAAEPLDVESDFDRAEGGGGSVARAAGIGGRRCWRNIASAAISWSQRLRQIPGVKCNEPDGAFYAYPNISAAFSKRHRRLAAILAKAAGGRARRGGSGRSVRHQ